jgi:restriction system protein
MAQNNWSVSPSKKIVPDHDDEDATIDIEELINDQISNQIIQKFKGSKMEDLINELLKAKGFNTYRSAEGADHGVDILASSGTLGFGSPKICVQVKTSDTPIDRPTLDQLIGTMSNYNADYGLLVSWSGFKASVIREIPKHFFKVRLWDAQTILNEIYTNYDKLSDDIRMEIPLKRVWLLSDQNNSIG